MITYPLRLTQGHLTLLATCPRKFQHLVLDQLGTPDAIEQQARLLQGARFHQLLQQWWLQLPIAPLLQSDAQMQGWFQSFEQVAPQILDPATAQQPESDRSLSLAGYLLTVRYDLLMLGTHHAKILDWKTYPRPQATRWLEQNWQTRLYPFILAETSNYAPEQIAIVYWFFQADVTETTPSHLTLTYDRTKHAATRQDLTRLLTQLTTWLEQYQAGVPFPQVGWEAAACAHCSFAARCDRAIAPAAADPPTASPNWTADLPNHLPTLAEIAEIPL